MIAITAALPAIAKACLSIDNTNDGAAGVPTFANALECNVGEDDMLVRESPSFAPRNSRKLFDALV
jgi:hypothetical protein